LNAKENTMTRQEIEKIREHIISWPADAACGDTPIFGPKTVTALIAHIDALRALLDRELSGDRKEEWDFINM
jgi:hypothetical protein